jgi:large subunit ribosomal protein L10
MALTRASKTEKVGKLAAELEHSTSAIIGTFKGLTASKDFELRKAVRGAGGSYHVVKNKLAARAAKGTKIEQALQGLKGVSAVAYTSGDPVALAKALSTWVKDNAEFTFKLGIIDGKVIDVREIGELATMPGKEELFSKLLFLINSPAQRLATVINATGRNLAVVINQGVDKGKFAGPAASPAAAEPKAEAPAAVEAKAEAPAAVEAKTEAPAAVEAAAHVEESAAGEQPSGAAQPENSTASQGGEAATSDPVEG